jgi:uncharacterized protein YfaS (alpha-2-macroglobulin family)
MTPYESVALLRGGEVIGQAKAGEPIAWNADANVSAGETLEVRVVGADDARAHVSWLQTGVPAQPPADASGGGMKLTRRYLGRDGTPIRDNAVRSGDLVKVELTVESAHELQNVVIEDLLPAGLEIENPRLVTQAGTSAALQVPDDDGPTFAPRRVDMRDDRLILVGDLTRAGPATYVYTARAVAPGTFVVPPVRGECMYDVAINAVAGGGGGTLRVTAVGDTGLAGASDE